jgi:hypothetical protein
MNTLLGLATNACTLIRDTTHRMATPELEKAFSKTHYWVQENDSNSTYLFKIRHITSGHAKLFNRYEINTAAIVTADNPHSTRRTNTDNQAARASLKQALTERGYQYLNTRHEAIDDSGQADTNWPDEFGYLILNIDYSTADALARDYQQSAFVWIGADKPPTLCFIEY